MLHADLHRGKLRRQEADIKKHTGDRVPNARVAEQAPVAHPLSRTLDLEALRQPQMADSGVNAVFGRWPGDETDEEIFDALRELS